MNLSDLRRAVGLATSDWDAAHRIVQPYEDPTACWIHAVLHKIEGDQGNSRYWYGRAGKVEYADRDPADELRAIEQSLAAPEAGADS